MTEPEIAAFLAAEGPPSTDFRWRVHMAANKAMRRRAGRLSLADVAARWDRAMKVAETATNINPVYWVFKTDEQKRKKREGWDREGDAARPEAGHAANGRIIRGTRSLGG